MGKASKKKYIDPKKDAIRKFMVGHRSQQDPLIADENAPQHVLIEVEEGNSKETAKQYGIYFDDDYNYLQHIRGVKEVIDWQDNETEVYTIRKIDKKEKRKKQYGLNLPSSVFESYVEEPIGLLNKAAPVTGPQPSLDPDIVCELDRMDCENPDSVFNEHAIESGDIPDDFILMLDGEIDCNLEQEDKEDFTIRNWLMATENDDTPPPLETFCDDQHFEEVVEKQRPNYLSDVDEEDEDEDINLSSDVEDENEFAVSDDDEKRNIYHKFSQFIGTQDHYPRKMKSDHVSSKSHNKFFDTLGNSESKDTLGNLGGRRDFHQDDSDTRSKTSSKYSHSSSVLPRNKNLQFIDDKFDYISLHEYRPEQVGLLDQEEIHGQFDLDSEEFKRDMEITKRQIRKIKMAEEEQDEDTLEWTRKYCQTEEIFHYKEPKYMVEESSKPMYDCEQVLEMKASYDNEPRNIHYIDDIKAEMNYRNELKKARINLHGFRGYPKITEKPSLTKKALAKHDNNILPVEEDTKREFDMATIKSCLSDITYRSKRSEGGETAEMRRARKEIVKIFQKERRIEKKNTKIEFKERKKLEVRQKMNIRKSQGIAVV